MRDNPIQFAVVREDPLIEAELLRGAEAGPALLIGSGGCTALSLAALFPGIELSLVDPNPAQLDLIRRKAEALDRKGADRKRLFNIGDADADGFNNCGNFESLFRSMRRFLNEFVMPEEEMARLFGATGEREDARIRLTTHPFWPVAFDLHFCDSVLRALFGEAAVQHAPKGSYPRYFQGVFERGFAREGVESNYFLHHVFLGCYLEDGSALPPYLMLPAPRRNFSYLNARIDAVEGLERFSVVSVSNILDWMSESEILTVAAFLGGGMRPGARLLFRQLNHHQDFGRHFSGFAFDEALGENLLRTDRSLFYSRIMVATKL